MLFRSGVAAPESVTRGDYFVRVRGAGLPTAQPPGMILFLPADGVPAPESMTWGDYFVRVRGAGLPTAQPLGIASPSWSV